MKIVYSFLTFLILSVFFPGYISSQQKSPGTDIITSSDLESYVRFLASPLLNGRKNGDPGLDIAQEYIVSNAKLLGLKPVNGTSYLQPYQVIKKAIDPKKSVIRIVSDINDTTILRDNIYQFFPEDPSDISIEGEVVFAGYGLNRENYNYNDFEGIPTEGKILLVMTRSPTSEDGSKYLFEGDNWSDFRSYAIKLRSLLFSRAKAIIFVMDPKSGFTSLEEQDPGIASAISSSIHLKGDSSKVFSLPGMMRILFVNRSVADELLKGTGQTLTEIQNKIDSELRPESLRITGKHILIDLKTSTEEITLNNIAGYIEGSDPVLKNEFIVFSSHTDHIGGSGRIINYGADDNATGCAALLSIAEAFRNLEKKPLRSIMFLWVSGEEIGLFGSEYYVNNPLVPLENTVADLNMDMIGRVKGVADTTSDNPMSGPNEVFVITGNQSRELVNIAKDVDDDSPLDFDYSLSGRNHPLQLFTRSDHYNFVKKDIPVLFFTTGLHTDYHTPGDVVEKIDFIKMEKITEALFRIGSNVANMKSRLKVNNPFSKW
jgi:hypothetical protein